MVRFDKKASQALKGIAILMLVLHHCFRNETLFEGYAVSFFPFSQDFVISLASMCKICVSIFAFISGYGLFLSYKTTKTSPSRWMAGRYIRTFSGFWFVFAVMAAANLVVGRFGRVYFADGAWRGIAAVALDFLGLSKLFDTPTMITTWWYMSAALTFIVLMPLIYRALDRAPWVTLAAALILTRLTLSHVAGGAFPGHNAPLTFVPAFLGGAAFASRDVFARWGAIGRSGPARALKCAAELALIIACGVFYDRLPLEEYWEMHLFVAPVVLIAFLAEFVLPLHGLNKALGFLGHHSMNIFLVHTFIRTSQTGHIDRLIYSCQHFAAITLVLFALSLLVSIAMEWIKKLIRYDARWQRALKRIERPDQPKQ